VRDRCDCAFVQGDCFHLAVIFSAGFIGGPSSGISFAHETVDNILVYVLDAKTAPFKSPSKGRQNGALAVKQIRLAFASAKAKARDSNAFCQESASGLQSDGYTKCAAFSVKRAL
jgi:hypothetical protein